MAEIVKQFPDLMAGKKVMYVHGFGSSAQSGTVRRLRQVLSEATVIAEDLPVHPAEAMALLRRLCQEEQPDLIIGTSMGGMYTEMLYGYDRIVINPALRIADTMEAHGMTGAQKFQNPRRDGVQDFMVTKAMVREYKELTTHCFEGVNDEERQRVVGLFGDRDNLVDTFDLFHSHYPTAIHFHGEHRMDDHSYMHSVMPVIRWIDDRQQGRQRPTVLITTDTMADQGGLPASSMQKAVRMLIEHYNVWFVTPQPLYSDSPDERWTAWLEEYVNVPAYDHQIACNHTELLMGDFLISREENSAFLGTSITFGSPTFKSWEDIITYFSRILGI